MGPWTAKFDDGLEVRKAAYETMYTLVRCSDHLGFVNRLAKFFHFVSASSTHACPSLTYTSSLAES